MIKLLLEIKSSFLSFKIRFSLKVSTFKVDINLLKQHCKPADWMAEWLNDSRQWGTQRALEQSGTQGTWALWHLRHSDIGRALMHLGTRGSWALGHSKSIWAFKHSCKRALRHSRHPKHFIQQTPTNVANTLSSNKSKNSDGIKWIVLFFSQFC